MLEGAEVKDPRRASITDDIAPDEMTPEKARELLEQAGDDGRVLGTDPLVLAGAPGRAARLSFLQPFDWEDAERLGRDMGRELRCCGGAIGCCSPRRRSANIPALPAG